MSVCNADWYPSGQLMGPTVCFVDNGVNLFAGTYHNGVFRSTDKGIIAQWFAVSDTSVFVLTREGGAYCSSNGGLSWTQVNSRFTDTSIRSLAVCDSILFAGTLLGGLFLGHQETCTKHSLSGSVRTVLKGPEYGHQISVDDLTEGGQPSDQVRFV